MRPKLTNMTKTTSTRPVKARAPQSAAVQKRASRVRKAPQDAPIAHPAPVNNSVCRPGSKKGTIEAMVRRSEGTAITDLMAATGWQEHSIRAVLTGLRKAGCTIVHHRNDWVSRYRIVGTV